eukprot:Unigene1679_Nuclearia_a/m.5167 Unigene1679_Nuclearia_a/g.5167  ORF Unigene1679_Nuclearia_a/g.5167 Unigene1679_Nuclearia_a/m.5167 type:complete len:310 (+) Unigene1679_Nuclearia_a:449-1378(+)
MPRGETGGCGLARSADPLPRPPARKNTGVLGPSGESVLRGVGGDASDGDVGVCGVCGVCDEAASTGDVPSVRARCRRLLVDFGSGATTSGSATAASGEIGESSVSVGDCDDAFIGKPRGDMGECETSVSDDLTELGLDSAVVDELAGLESPVAVRPSDFFNRSLRIDSTSFFALTVCERSRACKRVGSAAAAIAVGDSGGSTWRTTSPAPVVSGSTSDAGRFCTRGGRGLAVPSTGMLSDTGDIGGDATVPSADSAGAIGSSFAGATSGFVDTSLRSRWPSDFDAGATAAAGGCLAGCSTRNSGIAGRL